MDTITPVRAVLLAVAISVSLGGCGQLVGEKAPALSSTMKVASVAVDGGKQSVLMVSSLQPGGLGFTRPPHDLNGAWAIEVTAGIYDDAPDASFASAIFGLEADLRGATQTPTQFYGVYCRYVAAPDGIQVFGSSNTGNLNQTFFAGARVIDLRLQTDGATVTYLARNAAVGGVYSSVGTRSLQTPAGPHQAGFGVFGAAKGSAYGFSKFRIPANGAPAVAQPASQAALAACYEASLAVLDASYALNVPVVVAGDVTAARAGLGDATTKLAAARALVAGLAKTKSPRDVALAAIDKARKEIDKADAGLEKKGPKAAKAELKAVTKKMFGQLRVITDQLITDEQRAALPGGGI